MLRWRIVAMAMVVVLLVAHLGSVARALPSAHSIIINLPAYRLYHYIGQDRVGIYDISIGHIRTPTPTSSDVRRFEIFQMVSHPTWRNPRTRQLVPPGPNNPLGTRWLGLMKIDKVVLTGRQTWEALARQYGTTVNEIFRANNLRSGTPVRAGQVVEIPYHNGYGIHGTNAPSSIGTPVSLGCMRMRNSDIERLFDRLPRGRRVPVTILYEPIRELIDPTTGEAFLEVNFDVYRRIPDWNSALSAAAARVAVPLNRWLEQLLQQPFAGSHILSGNPSVQNNHALVAVGALNIDGQFFLPMQAMERMLGVSYQHRDGEHFLGERRLIAAELQQVGAGVFLAARLIEEVAGRGYFFDALRNTLDFSVSRLVVDGTFVGYNNIFWHSEHGPMVEMAALGSSLGLVFTLGANGRIHVGGVSLVGMTIGSQTFICLREIRRLPLTVSWEAASGLIAISQRH